MASLLKAVRGSSGLFGRKHKKLPEEWDDTIKEPVLDGITFYVKYLGSTLVDEPNDQQTTADAIKAVIAMAKSSAKKLPRVALTVNPKGILTRDLSTGDKHLDFSIYRISFCSADANYDRVVAFIGTNKNEILECHAFLCSKRKVAQAAALTISQAFNIAFELWERAKEEKSSLNGEEQLNLQITNSVEVHDFNCQNGKLEDPGTLIDLNIENHSASETMKKLGFDNDHNLDDSFSSILDQHMFEGPKCPNKVQKKLEQLQENVTQVQENPTNLIVNVTNILASDFIMSYNFYRHRGKTAELLQLAHARTHPMLGVGLNAKDLQDIQLFVNNQKKINEKDGFLEDHVDDLLCL